MKHGKIILLAVLFLALGAITWEVLPVAYFLFMFAMEPAGRGCDEGQVTTEPPAAPRCRTRLPW
jgi:hypothetical protein